MEWGYVLVKSCFLRVAKKKHFDIKKKLLLSLVKLGNIYVNMYICKKVWIVVNKKGLCD